MTKTKSRLLNQNSFHRFLPRIKFDPLLYSLMASFITLMGEGIQAQTYNTFYDNNTTLKPIASEIDSLGNLWIVGGDPVPFVAKLDSNGNELLYKVFSWFPVTESKDGYLDDIVITPMGEIWVTGYHTDPLSFIMQLDENGDTLYYNKLPHANEHSEKSRWLLASGNQVYAICSYSTNQAENVDTYIHAIGVGDNKLYINEIVHFDDWYMSRSWYMGIYVDEPMYNIIGDPIISLQRYSTGLEFSQVLLNENYVTMIDDSVPNFCLTEFQEGYIGIESDKPVWYRHFLVRQNSNYNLLDSLEIKRYSGQNDYSNSSGIQDVIPTNFYGVVAVVNTTDDSIKKIEALQINPDNFEITDSIAFDFENSKDYVDDLAIRDHWIYGIQTHYGGYSGIRVHRIYLPKLETTTSFYLSNKSKAMVPESLGFTVYPNPTEDIINVNFSEIKTGKLKLYSLTGALVMERAIQNSSYQLDVSFLPQGVYVLQMQSENQNMSKKIVVK